MTLLRTALSCVNLRMASLTCTSCAGVHPNRHSFGFTFFFFQRNSYLEHSGNLYVHRGPRGHLTVQQAAQTLKMNETWSEASLHKHGMPYQFERDRSKAARDMSLCVIQKELLLTASVFFRRKPESR